MDLVDKLTVVGAVFFKGIESQTFFAQQKYRGQKSLTTTEDVIDLPNSCLHDKQPLGPPAD